MREFIYDGLGEFLSYFFYSYYPTSIFLLSYLLYLLAKKKQAYRLVLAPLVVLSFLPTVLIFLFAVLELSYTKEGDKWAYMVVFFGVGIVINFVSAILLYRYEVRRRQARVSGEPPVLH